MKVEIRRASETEDACHLYRLGHPARVLAAQGHDVTTITGPIHAYKVNVSLTEQPGSGLTHVAGFDTEADVLVFGRLMDREAVQAIPAMQRAGHAVVIEVDDDFHALPAGHPARQVTASRWNPDRNRRWLRKACELADLVTVSTPALAARYGAHGRCVILPNLIPESYLGVNVYRDGHTLGWTGHTANHIDDLRVVGDGVAEAMAVNPSWRFRHIGPRDMTAVQLGLTDVSTSGVTSLEDYPAAYAALDLAIAPLQPSAFNEAKSWLKPLEAAALGVPCICSPTDEYNRAIMAGFCLPALNPQHWSSALRLLMASETTRNNHAAYGREQAARYTYEQHAGLWWAAWETARMNHRARRSEHATQG